MGVVINSVMTALSAVVVGLPIGTNLGRLHFLWMLVTGSLLPSRGALFPALWASGLSQAAVRRAWAAFRNGAWQIAVLLSAWRVYITETQQWHSHCYEGYRPVAIDITAFWRPTLKGLETTHYHPQAGKAQPAVPVGIVAHIGSLDKQRVALPSAFIRANDNASGNTHQADLIAPVSQTLASDELVVADAGFKIAEFQAAGIERYVVRLAKNFTARRNRVAPYNGRGRKPIYGQLVRPLARQYKGRTLEKTPPDECVSWIQEGQTIWAEIWYNLVLPDVIPNDDAVPFNVTAIYDPRFAQPWVLASPLPLTAVSLKQLYHDRWPIEQLPLAAKQMIGADRQFVFAKESCQRLPELALLAGSILTYLAATLPAMPTGFWDRQPRPTPGRLRRVLMGRRFPQTYPLPLRLRKKASVTTHLLKGVWAHRRTKSSTELPRAA